MVTAGSWLEVEATWSCCAWISARTCSRMRLKRPVSDSPETGSGSVWGVGGIGVVVETDLVDARVDGLDERRTGACELRRPRLEDLVLGMTIGERSLKNDDTIQQHKISALVTACQLNRLARGPK